MDYEQMYQQYYHSIYAFIRHHINQTETAQDLTADVFAASYRNWNKFDPNIANICTWLYCIARNRLKNYYRTQKRLISLEELSEQGDSFLAVENQVQKVTEIRDALERILQLLPQRNREAVALRYFAGKSNQEIADILQISHENTRVILTRTLKKMYDMLKEQGFSLEE